MKTTMRVRALTGFNTGSHWARRMALGSIGRWLMALLLFASSATTRAQAPAGTVRGFSLPVFGENDTKKMEFTGQSIQSGAQGGSLIKEFGIVFFGDDEDQKELIIKAPECLFDMESRTGRSAGPIEVSTGDERFAIKGEGFQWNQATEELTISNKVHTLIRKDVLQEGSADVGNVVVTSRSFTFSKPSNNAVYRERVRALDPGRLDLSCELLQVKLPAQGGGLERITAEDRVVIQLTDEGRGVTATCGKAVYTIGEGDNEGLELSENPTWKSDDYQGSGDLIVVDASASATTFSVIGSARVRLPRPVTDASEQGASEREVEIFSHSYDYNDDRVVFNQDVRATQGEDWRMTCGTMTAFVDKSNRTLARIEAENDVVLFRKDETGESTARGQKAVYTPTSDGAEELLLAGDAEFQSPEYQGAGDELQLNSQGEAVEFSAVGNASLTLMQVAALNLGIPLAQAESEATTTEVNRTVTIQAHEYDFKAVERRAVFDRQVRLIESDHVLSCGVMVVRFEEGLRHLDEVVASDNVMLTDGSAHLACERMKAVFAGPTKALDNVVAENNVVIIYPEGRASGAHAVFNVLSQRMVLSGEPIVETVQIDPTAKNRHRVVTEAEQFIWDEKNKTMQGRGRYRSRTYPISPATESPPSDSQSLTQTP